MQTYVLLIIGVVTVINLRVAYLAGKRFLQAEQVSSRSAAVIDSKLSEAINLKLLKLATNSGADTWALAHHLTSARALMERMRNRADVS